MVPTNRYDRGVEVSGVTSNRAAVPLPNSRVGSRALRLLRFKACVLLLLTARWRGDFGRWRNADTSRTEGVARYHIRGRRRSRLFRWRRHRHRGVFWIAVFDRAKR